MPGWQSDVNRKGRVWEKWDTEDNGWIDQINRMMLVNDWNLKIEQIGSDQNIQEAIQSGKALAVLDGSFQEQCGACAWIIKGKNNTDCIIGTMTVPSSEGNHSSFRSKAAGLYGLLLTMWYMVWYKGPSQWHVMGNQFLADYKAGKPLTHLQPMQILFGHANTF